MGPSSSVKIRGGCDACVRQPRSPWALVAASLVMLWDVLCVVVVALRTIDVVVVAVVLLRNVASALGHPHHTHTGPENSSNDQCHAHDICNLYWAGEQAPGRSHHPHNSQHIHIRPRRNPHMRLDRRKNFVSPASPHDAAPTKNFVFDSHWQQSHSIRWSYILARKLAGSTRRHLQKCVVCDVVWMVLVAHSIHGLQMVMQLVNGLR